MAAQKRQDQEKEVPQTASGSSNQSRQSQKMKQVPQTVIGSSSDAGVLEQNLQEEAQGKAQDPQTVIGSPRDAEIQGEQKLATQNQQEYQGKAKQ